MSAEGIEFSYRQELPPDEVLELYRANQWSSAEKPLVLMKALRASHSVASAWHGERLIGLGNAISDGHLVVYYPHLLVLPQYCRRGIGTLLMRMLIERYEGFHQHVIMADGGAIEFYEKCGFVRAGKTVSMWIYEGKDH